MKAILQVINQMRQEILSGKRESRKKLAALSFAQKLVLLEKLRDRSLLIASSSLRQQRQHAQRSLTPESFFPARAGAVKPTAHI